MRRIRNKGFTAWDAAAASCKTSAAAVTHFDKGHMLNVAHDEIDLARLGAEIASDQLKPLPK